MKRAWFIAGFAFLALVGFSQFGSDAANRTLAERFAGAPKDGVTGVYTFDKAHSFIGFKVKHMGLSEVPGYFRDFKGTINYNAEDVTKSTVEFTAEATSVDTGVTARDNHLRTPDFFDVAKFPELTFKSTKVEKKGKQLIITGDFTLKGVTKSLTFPFDIVGFLPADDRSGGKIGVSAQTTINRHDYGVNFGNSTMLSDDIKIDLSIEAGKAK